MRIRHLFLAAALPAALVLIGCGPTSPTGGGGTGKETTKETTKTTGPGETTKSTEVKPVDNKDNTFKIDASKVGLAPGLKQGESKTYDVMISKEKNFKEDVDLSATAPEKLTVEFNPKKVDAAHDGKVQMTVKAADDTPVGEHTVKVTAKPAKGETTSVDIKFKVDKK